MFEIFETYTDIGESLEGCLRTTKHNYIIYIDSIINLVPLTFI